jgi:hypothetical protein
MKARHCLLGAAGSTIAACLLFVSQAQGAVSVEVGPSTDPWLGFMNVSNLPAPDGDGVYQFGSDWGVPDLTAVFDDGAGTLTLGPNTIGDPDPYWYQGGGGPGAQGNKIMDANLYIQVQGALAGETVTFSGDIADFSLTQAHQAFVFIRDFAPDFSSFEESSQPITGTGPFSISLDTIDDPNRFVQYGFQMIGENVWVTDVDPFGSVVVGTIPEPSVAILGLAGGLLWMIRRRRA